MKRVLITGSSRGIGAAIAVKVAQMGMLPVLHCRSQRAQAVLTLYQPEDFNAFIHSGASV